MFESSHPAPTVSESITIWSRRPSGSATSFGDGAYEVGVDVAAGRYKTPVPTDDLFKNCSWQPVDHRQRRHPGPGRWRSRPGNSSRPRAAASGRSS